MAGFQHKDHKCIFASQEIKKLIKRQQATVQEKLLQDKQ